MNTRLAERLSIFWADWHGVDHGPVGTAGLRAADRLDLFEHGRLLTVRAAKGDAACALAGGAVRVP